MICLNLCTAIMYLCHFLITHLIRSGGLFSLLQHTDDGTSLYLHPGRQIKVCSFHVLMELTVISVQGQETLWSFTVPFGC